MRRRKNGSQQGDVGAGVSEPLIWGAGSINEGGGDRDLDETPFDFV